MDELMHWKAAGKKLAEENKELARKFMLTYGGKTAYIRASWSKYKDRPGKIDGAFIDENGLHALVYVYRHGSTEILNSDGQTRSYWPLDQIEIAR